MTSSLKVEQFCIKIVDLYGTYYQKIRRDMNISHAETVPSNTVMLITGEDLRKLQEYYTLTQGNYEAAVLCHFPHLAKEE